MEKKGKKEDKERSSYLIYLDDSIAEIDE